MRKLNNYLKIVLITFLCIIIILVYGLKLKAERENPKEPNFSQNYYGEAFYEKKENGNYYRLCIESDYKNTTQMILNNQLAYILDNTKAVKNLTEPIEPTDWRYRVVFSIHNEILESNDKELLVWHKPGYPAHVFYFYDDYMLYNKNVYNISEAELKSIVNNIESRAYILN